MKLDLRRTIVALSAACALAMVAAAPASAATSHNGVVTGGTLTITATGQPTEFINLTPDPTCPPSTVVLTNANESGSTGTSTLTNIAITAPFYFGGTGPLNRYIAVITGNSTTGTGTSASNWTTATTPDSFTGLGLRLTVKFYQGSPCTINATALKCTWILILPANGTYAGDISHPASSDVLTSSSTTAGTMTLGASCGAPFTTYTTGNITSNNVTIHITTF